MKKLLLSMFIAGLSLGGALFAVPQTVAACDWEDCNITKTQDAALDGVATDCVEDESAATTCDDGDGVSAPVESGALSEGDGNGDLVPDSIQNDVTSLPNPNDTVTPNSYVTVEILPAVPATTTTPPCIPLPESICLPSPPITTPETPSIWAIKSVETVNPTTQEASNSSDVNLPYGLFKINLAVKDEFAQDYANKDTICENCPGGELCALLSQQEVKMRIIFDRVLDDWSQLSVSKLLGGAYTNYSATIQNEYIGNDLEHLRTTIRFSLFDGGLGDTDGEVNGEIKDPIGPSKPAVVTTAATTTTTTAPQLAHTGVNTILMSIIALGILISSVVVVARPVKQ